MNQTRNIIRKLSIYLVIFVQLISFPVLMTPRIVVAQEAPETTATTETCPTTTGTTAPTGTAAHTFTFTGYPQCVWENQYYTWDPITKTYTPKYDTHVCDEATGVCETVEWTYVTSDYKYVEKRTVVYVPPAPETPDTSTQSSAAEPTQTGYNGASNPDLQTTAAIESGNGTDSENNIGQTNGSNLDLNNVNNISILQLLNSTATSGDASALFNTTVGDVSTGDAATIANLLNMIQSSWNPDGGITLFSADLLSNYYGDLLFDPSILLGNGTGSLNTVSSNTDTDLTVTVENNADIQNDINLNATSGDATANGNTTVGDVSTGDATAIANIINMINSAITAGSSFIGSLNLYGDLNGDILLPENLMSILLGNGTDSTNTLNGTSTTNMTATANNTNSITNNYDLSATSGSAEANGNTTVGNLSTGDATTEVNEMNLIGQNYTAPSGLMVFVNVLGSWYGMLFGGLGSAAITAGNGTGSTNTIDRSSDTDADLQVDNNYSITNNLNLNATSGNATANANTTVGNVRTGDANTSANVLNMIDSQMTFTNWFGMLFINVFGEWFGSFGTDTEAGETPVGGSGGAAPVAAASGPNQPSTSGAASQQADPTSLSAAARSFAREILAADNAEDDSVNEDAQVAAMTDTDPPQDEGSATNTVPVAGSFSATPKDGVSVAWIAGTTGIFSLLMLGGERLLTLMRRP